MPCVGEVAQATLWVENLSPDPRQREKVIGGRQWRGLLFDEHPGNGGGIAQVDGEFQVRATEEGVLAGQAADQAGQVGVTGKVVVPDRLVTVFADTVQAMPTTVVQGRPQGRLAGGDAQQQGFGAGAVTVQVDQGGSDHILTQFIRRDTHDALEQLRAGRALELGSW
ncbi:hypothetical protein D3C85_1239240 [compost metagenome]